ncbi:MAG: hypothetical protein KC503_43570 [Myxococcales bacterium]|nr:hypothetical protein [Myxococcales bacterium]
MPTINVNWPDVETAFERNSPGLHSYIDRNSGEVLVVVDGSADDEDKRRRIAKKPSDFVRIDPASSREQYRWMERFVATVDDKPLRDRLLIAIDGKGAFRRFKDVLLSFPAERERWFNYRADLLHHHINRWFEARGDTPAPQPPWGDVQPPPEPEEPLPRATSNGEGPADVLRKQIKALIDVLPAGELHSARVFLEYLRDRGSAELNGARGKIDLRRPFRRRAAGSHTEDDDRDDRDDDDHDHDHDHHDSSTHAQNAASG